MIKIKELTQEEKIKVCRKNKECKYCPLLIERFCFLKNSKEQINNCCKDKTKYENFLNKEIEVEEDE